MSSDGTHDGLEGLEKHDWVDFEPDADLDWWLNAQDLEIVFEPEAEPE